MSAAWKYMGKPQLDVAWSNKEWNLSKMKFVSKASWFSSLIQIWRFLGQNHYSNSVKHYKIMCFIDIAGKKVKCFFRGFPCCPQGEKTNGTADVLYVACKRIQVATQLVHWAVLNISLAVSRNWVQMTDIWHTSGACVHMSTQHTSGITVCCCCVFYCPIVLNALLSNFRLKGAITITCIIIIFSLII